MPDRRFAWGLIVLAVAARAAAVLVLQSHTVPHSTYEHGAIAANLLAGRGFSVRFLGAEGPTSQQAPVYPVVVAAAYALGGVETPRALLILELGQSALGGLLVAGVLMLAREVAPGRVWVARVAGLIAALHPALVYAATHVQVALPAATLLTFTLAWAYRTGRTGRDRDAVVTGAWLALLALTDPILMLAAAGVAGAIPRRGCPAEPLIDGARRGLASFGENRRRTRWLRSGTTFPAPKLAQLVLASFGEADARGVVAVRPDSRPPEPHWVRFVIEPWDRWVRFVTGPWVRSGRPTGAARIGFVRGRGAGERAGVTGLSEDRGRGGPSSSSTGARRADRGSDGARRSFRLLAIVGLTALAGLTPWTVRNYRVHGGFVAVKSTFGYAFWQGNCALSEGTDKVVRASVERALDRGRSLLDPRGLNAALWAARHEAGYLDDVALTAGDYRALGAVSEPERSRRLFHRAVADLRAEPGRYARLCLRRLRYFVLFDETNPKTRNVVYRGSHLALTGLAVLGLVLARPGVRRRLGPTVVTVALVAAFHALTIVSARFHIPIEPLLGLWAACGLTRFGSGAELVPFRAQAQRLSGI